MELSSNAAAWIGIGVGGWLLIWRVWLFRAVLKIGLKLSLLLGPILLLVVLGLGILGQAA